MRFVDVLQPILALVHIGSALFYVTGYASAKTLSSLAVAESDPVKRRWILGLGDTFDFRFQIWGGTITGLSGIPLALADGYSLTQAWVLASIVLYVIVVFIGAVIWRRRSATVREALDAGDDARVLALLTEPRARLIGWVELALVVTIVVLMVLRPG
jgi:predicted integral membrane protein DUF2269